MLPPFQHVSALLTQFSTSKDDRHVDSAELKAFMAAVAAEHGLVNLDAAAVSDRMIAEGFATAYTIATTDMADLQAVGMGRAHAEIIYKYLGGRSCVNVQQIGQAQNVAAPDAASMMQAT